MAVNEQFPSLMPILYPGSMATGPKPYASLDKVWKAFGDLSNNNTPAVNGERFFSLPVSSSGVRSPALSGPRPAGHGPDEGRGRSRPPSWRMGSSQNPIVMSVIDPTDPWTDNTSKCWKHRYAEVFAVCASFETDDPPLWSALLSPSARAAALPEDTPFLTRVAV